MPEFNGIHGTSQTAGRKICRQNFTIPDDQPPSNSMFGHGVYFYRQCKEAKWAAIKWGNKRRQANEDICIIWVNIAYQDEDAFFFSHEEFDLVVRQIEDKKGQRLSREKKNILRAKILEEAVKASQASARLILAELPAFGPCILGCIVRDIEILPHQANYKIELVQPWTA